MYIRYTIYTLTLLTLPLQAGLSRIIVETHYDVNAPSFDVPLHIGVATGSAKATHEVLHNVRGVYTQTPYIRRISRLFLGTPTHALIGFGIACVGYYPIGSYLYKKFIG